MSTICSDIQTCLRRIGCVNLPKTSLKAIISSSTVVDKCHLLLTLHLNCLGSQDRAQNVIQ